jgi:cell division transport system permease protein
MRLRSWAYFWAQALRSLRHAGWMSVASVSTVALALFVLGFFGVLSANMQHAAASLSQQVEMQVFFQPTATHGQELRVVDLARSWPGVRRVQYFTKTQALDQLKAEFPHDQDLWSLIQQGNPLYDGFNLYTATPSRIPPVAARLRALPVVHEVVYQALVVERLTTITRVLQDGGYVIDGILALATLFIVSNTIRLGVFARRREIAVMKLVGATDWFIRWPFLVEGLLLGLLGAVVADAAILFGYQWLLARAAASLAFWPLAPLSLIQRSTVMPDLIGGVAMGVLGSLWALRRFLNV